MTSKARLERLIRAARIAKVNPLKLNCSENMIAAIAALAPGERLELQEQAIERARLFELELLAEVGAQ